MISAVPLRQASQPASRAKIDPLPTRQQVRLSPGGLALLLALLAYLALAGYQLNMPGPHYDEAVEVLPTIAWLRGQPAEVFRNAGVTIGGQVWPLMSVDYIGALNAYLTYPAFLLFGIGVVQMRLMPLLGGVWTLIALYLAVRAWAGRSAAGVAVLLLAVQPSFVFWTRQGIFVTSMTMPLLATLLWLLLKACRSQRSWALGAVGFVAGFGLWVKFLFLWPLVGLAVCLGLITLREKRSPLRPTRRTLLATTAAFVLGLWPLLLFNLETRGTVATFGNNLSRSYYGVNNADYFTNLGQRLIQLGDVMGGFQLWYLGAAFTDRLAWPLFMAAALLALLRALRLRQHLMTVLLPLVLIGAIVLQSPITPSALWHTHFAILLPLLPASLGVNLALIAHSLSQRFRRWATALLVAVVLLAGGSALYTDLRYHQALSASGGRAAHSDASLQLARAIEGFPPGEIVRVVAMDWGISAPVALLTQGRFMPVELFGYDSLTEPPPNLEQEIGPLLVNDRTLFIFHSRPDYTVYQGRRAAFDRLVADRGKESVVVIPIHERDGTPAYDLLRVEPKR